MPIKVIKQITAHSDCVNFLIITIPPRGLFLLKFGNAQVSKLQCCEQYWKSSFLGAVIVERSQYMPFVGCKLTQANQ
jgi:hypothetical protein